MAEIQPRAALNMHPLAITLSVYDQASRKPSRTMKKSHDQHENDRAPSTDTESPGQGGAANEIRPREIGGRDGPEPTRYGDWEKNGRCIDF